MEDVRRALKGGLGRLMKRSSLYQDCPHHSASTAFASLLNKTLRACLNAYTFPVTSMILNFDDYQPHVISALNANQLLEVGVEVMEEEEEEEEVLEEGTSEMTEEEMAERANLKLHDLYESLHSRGFTNPQEQSYFDFLESALSSIGHDKKNGRTAESERLEPNGEKEQGAAKRAKTEL